MEKATLPEGPYIIVANHTSYLDIFLLYSILPKSPFVFLGKSEILKYPILGTYFKHMNIPVYRQNKSKAGQAYSMAFKAVAEGWSIVIFPEGTIWNKTPELKEFKNGAFKLAVEKQVPIIPVINLNNWHFLQNGGFFKSNGKPGVPKVYVGDPIFTKGMTEKDIDRLKEKVHIFTQEKLNKFNGK
jgi:1-acyl-sn-glycerol-3-phosphate acyltransferase